MTLQLLLCASIISPGARKPSGLELIRRMERMYAHLHSYTDSGTVTSGSNTIVFRTAYQAQGKMYFEYRYDSDETWFFCASGKKGIPSSDPDLPKGFNATKVTWLADTYFVGKVDHQSLELAIATFTGVSRGAAYNVPSMLYPRAAGRVFHELENPTLLRTESVDGEKCYVVKAGGDTLWISTKTYALWKLEEAFGSDPFVSTYKPILNPPISKDRFVFKAHRTHSRIA